MDFRAGDDSIGLKGVKFSLLGFNQVGRDTVLSLDGKEIGLFSNTLAATLANTNNFLGLI
jgi:hypothetical protein